MAEPLIRVENLCKHFQVGRDRILKAVDGVSFTIDRQRTLGLVGESGCGKTTVGRTLMRLYEPDGGRVLFEGKDIFQLSRPESKALTRRMQMIFQDPYASLNPYYTVEEIVSEGMRIHKMYKTRQEYRDRVFELLETVGLHREHASRFPHEFSGGQRQRVGIARALALNPEFIVCDEAISALDVSIQAQVVNMLVELQQKLNLTYLFIAHDLSMVRHISDRVGIMYLGSLVELAGIKGKASEKNNTLSDRLKAIDDKIATLKRTYEKEKARYWKQFNAMEQLIANMNSQSSWLAQQLG